MKITELSDAQRCLLIAKHEWPDAENYHWSCADGGQYEIHLGNERVEFIRMDWSTMGPLWEKYAEDYFNVKFDKMADIYRDKGAAKAHAFIISLEMSIKPRKIAEALIWLWYRDDIEEELL